METVKIGVKFGEENLIFRLKVISVAEEKQLRAKHFGKTEDEIEKSAFADNLQILSDYEAEPAEKISVGEKGETVKTKVVLREYFSEQSPSKDRILDYVVRAYLISLQPTIDFF